MAFNKEQLQTGETIVIQTHPHMVTVWAPLVLLFVALIAASWMAQQWESFWFLLIAVPFIVWFLWKWLLRVSNEYIVTSSRVVKQHGLFVRSTLDAPLDKINNIFHEQNFFQRMINNGKVGLETASELGMVEFANVPRPLAFKNAILSQRERYRSGYSAPAASDSPLSRLERLAKLKEQGAITEEEFQAKKKALMGEL
ncbi:MAG TPA: PH domain-containing protein [Acidobacteriota bacterium]|jgi:uncharacterized membrane protein YdbT with pleckstrin-like domain